MKKIFKLSAIITSALLVMIALVACGKKVSAEEIIKKVSFPFERGYYFADDFYLTSSITYDEEVYELKYTSSIDNVKVGDKVKIGDEEKYQVKVTQTDEDQVFELKATVNVDGKEASVTEKFRVARQLSNDELIKAIYDDPTGQTVSFTSYVTYICGNNYYVQNDKFGVYLYGANVTGTINVGDHVKIAGAVDEYNGARQLKNPTVRLFDDQKQNVDPTDITRKLVFNDNVHHTTGMYATLKNVKVTEVKDFDNEGSSTQTILTLERSGAKANVVVTKYLTPFNESKVTEIVNKLKTFAKDSYVDVTGFVTFYKGTLQLQMVSADDIVASEAPTIEDDEKLQEKLNTFDFNSKITSGGKHELPASDETFTYEYKLETEHTDEIKLEGNTLVVTVPKTGVLYADLTVTIKLGEKAVSKKIEITVVPYATKHAEYLDAKSGAEIQNVTGVVTVSSFAGGAGYAVVQDANGAYYIRVSDVNEDAWAEKFKVDYKVTIAKAEKGSYNGLHQLVSIDLNDVTLGEKSESPEVLDINDLIKNGENLEKYQGMLITVTAKVEKINKYDTSLKVGDKDFMYNYDSKISKKPTVTLEVGKTYTITGILGWYKNPQIQPLGVDAIVEVTNS